jgi:hypothetical protein
VYQAKTEADRFFGAAAIAWFGKTMWKMIA